MRKIFISFLIFTFLATAASAEVLLTANTLGEGKFGLKAAYMNTTNSLSTIMNNTGYGLMLGYGILPDLDIYGVAGYTDYANTGTIIPGYTVNGPLMGVIFKYRILADSESLPNLSGSFAYKVNNLTEKLPSSYYYEGFTSNLTIEDWGGGLIISKAFSTVVPYLATIYHTGSWISPYSAMRLTGLELTGGLSLLFSESTGVIIEYSSNSVTPQNGSGPAFSMSNISFSLGHRL